MHSPIFITPILAVHPDSIFLYNKIDYDINYVKKPSKSLLNLENNTHSSKLSDKAIRKAKRAMTYIITQAADKKVFNSKFNSSFIYKVGFLTLTLASKQIHSDNEIKQALLNQFLIECRKRYNMENYVWRAERQKNGNIHFHILTDSFLPYREIKQMWNRIQNKLGYVDRFETKYRHKQPNSTDIHSLRGIKDVKSYITKYMTKQGLENHSKVKNGTDGYWKRTVYESNTVSKGALKYLGKLSGLGRIWACSKNLSDLKGSVTEYESKYKMELDKLRKVKKVKTYIKDYFTCIYFDYRLLTKEDYPYLFELLSNYLFTKFGDRKEKTVWKDYFV
jgi:hypothetical protein